jgi:hypothetical protein
MSTSGKERKLGKVLFKHCYYLFTTEIDSKHFMESGGLQRPNAQVLLAGSCPLHLSANQPFLRITLLIQKKEYNSNKSYDFSTLGVFFSLKALIWFYFSS